VPGIRSVIDCVFAFEGAKDAFAHLESGSRLGKVVTLVSLLV
jgi:hypothetical protein